MSRARRALVIGAGLAGSAAAAALVHRGWRVTILAADDDGGASAVPAAVMAPVLGTARDPLTNLRRRGLAATEAWLARREIGGRETGRIARGAFLVPGNERDRLRHDRATTDTAEMQRLAPHAAPERLGLYPNDPGILHSRGGCFRPAAFAAALRASAGPALACRSVRVSRIESTVHGWSARDATGRERANAPVAVLAAGTGCRDLWPRTSRWLLPARGQATAFAATPESRRLDVPVSGGGYFTPAIEDRHWVGATLQRGDTDPTARPADDTANLEFARALLGLAEAPVATDRFVGFRATTPNRIPLVGALEQGLWITAGHGAHGLLTTLVTGALLAHAIDGRPHPWRRVLDPSTRRDGHPVDAQHK